MKTPLRVLFVEDSDDDVLLMTWELRQAGFETVCARVETAATLRSALAARTWDVAIVDYDLPRFSAPEALGILRSEAPELPCIAVSGLMAEEMVLSTMRLGAHDYLLKSNLVRLAPAVERELRGAERRRARRRVESDLVDRGAQLRAILDNLPGALITVEDSGAIDLFNRAAEQMFGYSAAEVQGAPISDLLAVSDSLDPGPARARQRDGTTFWVELAVGAARPGSQLLRIVSLTPARPGEELRAPVASTGEAAAALGERT